MTIAVGISEVYNKSTSRVRVLKWVTLYINPGLVRDTTSAQVILLEGISENMVHVWSETEVKVVAQQVSPQNKRGKSTK